MSVPPGIDRALGYRAAEDDPDYVAWTLLNALTPEVLAAASRRVATFRRRPLISVLVPVRDPDPRVLEMALHSVDAQAYPDWELCIVDDACAQPSIIELLQAYAGHRPGRACLRRLRSSTHIAGATNAALELARGEYVAFLDHDDELTPDALLEVVAALQDDPLPDVVYSDHDVLGPDERRRHPSFKPDWCPELLLSYMYFGHLKVYRTELVRALGGLRAGFEGSADYDLALRATERARTVAHLPSVAYHWRKIAGSTAQNYRSKPGADLAALIGAARDIFVTPLTV